MGANRILTTYVGSLPRPAILLALMRDKAEGVVLMTRKSSTAA